MLPKQNLSRFESHPRQIGTGPRCQRLGTVRWLFGGSKGQGSAFRVEGPHQNPKNQIRNPKNEPSSLGFGFSDLGFRISHKGAPPWPPTASRIPAPPLGKKREHILEGFE